jgi:hypothetical protein
VLASPAPACLLTAGGDSSEAVALRGAADIAVDSQRLRASAVLGWLNATGYAPQPTQAATSGGSPAAAGEGSCPMRTPAPELSGISG